jgi:SAM-dependent methyltransferase
MSADPRRAKRLIAASYDHASGDFARFADELIYSHLAAPLAKAIEPFGAPVLDVAGGTGALARLVSDATVSDIAHGQLVNNSAPRRVQSDAEALPFKDGCFAVAASAFGINHFPRPQRAVAEMARVAPVVGLLTWVRPERDPFDPKVIVLEAIARYSGQDTTEVGLLVEDMSEAVGSPQAIGSLLEQAGLVPQVFVITAEIPWPGTDRFIDYRLSMMGPDREIADVASFRREVAAAIDALPEDRRRWRPPLVLGIGKGERSARSAV